VVPGETAPSEVVVRVFVMPVERVGDDEKRLETPAELVAENAVIKGTGVAWDEVFDDSVAN
jgi:hypothetical protein